MKEEMVQINIRVKKSTAEKITNYNNQNIIHKVNLTQIMRLKIDEVANNPAEHTEDKLNNQVVDIKNVDTPYGDILTKENDFVLQPYGNGFKIISNAVFAKIHGNEYIKNNPQQAIKNVVLELIAIQNTYKLDMKQLTTSLLMLNPTAVHTADREVQIFCISQNHSNYHVSIIPFTDMNSHIAYNTVTKHMNLNNSAEYESIMNELDEDDI
jgi:hypothetical protein